MKTMFENIWYSNHPIFQKHHETTSQAFCYTSNICNLNQNWGSPTPLFSFKVQTERTPFCLVMSCCMQEAEFGNWWPCFFGAQKGGCVFSLHNLNGEEGGNTNSQELLLLLFGSKVSKNGYANLHYFYVMTGEGLANLQGCTLANGSFLKIHAPKPSMWTHAIPKRRGLSSNHRFWGVNSMLVSGSAKGRIISWPGEDTSSINPGKNWEQPFLKHFFLGNFFSFEAKMAHRI